MRTTAWLNKKYLTLHPATEDPFADEVRAELMPLCDQEAAEAVIYARGAALKEALTEIDRLRADNAKLAREAHTWWTACRDATGEAERLRGEADVLRAWIKAALVPLQSIADLEDFEDGGEGMNALIAAGRRLGA